MVVTFSCDKQRCFRPLKVWPRLWPFLTASTSCVPKSFSCQAMLSRTTSGFFGSAKGLDAKDLENPEVVFYYRIFLSSIIGSIFRIREGIGRAEGTVEFVPNFGPWISCRALA